MVADQSRWDSQWSTRQVQDDIRMQDFFSGRQFIAKFYPWWGKGLEAGCGLGRYVFYFSVLGCDITGVDFSSESVGKARTFALEHEFSPEMFVLGDIERLQFDDNAFSYYISLGVLEHFYEGPERALREAFRVLAPGGIILVTTPNKYSLEVIKGSMKKSITHAIVPLNGPKTSMVSHDADGSFFQYWYSQKEMSSFIVDAGFEVIEKNIIDIRFPLFYRSQHSQLAQWLFGKQEFINKLENSPLKVLGGNSVIVALKPGERMHCFFCGLEHSAGSLRKKGINVPTCDGCKHKYDRIVRHFDGKTPAHYDHRTEKQSEQVCAFCQQEFKPHKLFGDFGFSKAVCSDCVRIPRVRGELSAAFIKQTWKPY